MAIDPKKNTQILLTVSWELKEEIENYQFKSHIPSRTAAIIELIEKGLESNNKKEPAE